MADEAQAQPKETLTRSVKATDVAKEVGALRRAFYKRVREAHERGEFVAWTMWGVTEEVLAAMDVLPTLAENYGPVCAAKQIGPHFCQVAEAEGFSMDLCSYLRTGLGIAAKMHELGEMPPEAPYGGMGKPDMLIAPAFVCDGRYKYLQPVARYLDVPYFCYDIQHWPPGVDLNDESMRKRLVAHFLEQVKKMVAFIEKVTGRKLNKYRLSEALRNWVKVQNLYAAAVEFRTHHPCPLPAQDSATISFPNLHMKCWPETVEFYQKVYDEIKYRVEHNMSSVPEEKYRLFWNAIIPWYYIGLYNWLEESFGAVTLNYEYGGGDALDESIIDYDFPLESIAQKMYAKTWWRVSATEGDTRNLDSMVRWIKKQDIDGAISLMVASCRATQSVVHNWKLLRERLDIPTLGIEADMVDTRTYSDVLVKQRLTAFMETVDAAKRMRQRG